MDFSITSLLLFAIFLVLSFFFLSFFLLITVPGALVRLRENHNPKGLQLDPEDDVQPHTGLVITSFFFKLSRVRRLEGWAGLMKGTVPTLLSYGVHSHFSAIFLDASLSSPRNRDIYNSPATNIWGTLLYCIFLPLLPYFRPLHSLRVLLTPTERRKPWVLYLTPDDSVPQDLSPRSLTIFFAISLFSTAILCPLEVISTRLAVQKNHESAEFNSAAQEKVGDTKDLPEYSPDEDVIG
ncbi:mitochondrial carrier, partial [Lactarius sanguifluus]